MKKQALLMMCVLWLGCPQHAVIYAQGDRLKIGSNTFSIHPSAALEIDSKKGFLPPRMTSAEMRALTNAAEGLMVYDTNNHCIRVYGRSGWSGCFTVTKPHFSILNAVWDTPVYYGMPALSRVSIPYEGGTDEPIELTSSSTGVTGLTASVFDGSPLVSGNGTLRLQIVGDASGTGTAVFDLFILGEKYSLSLNVLPAPKGAPQDWADTNLGSNVVTTYAVGNLPSLTPASFGSYYQWGVNTAYERPANDPGHDQLAVDPNAPRLTQNWNQDNPCTAVGMKMPTASDFEVLRSYMKTAIGSNTGWTSYNYYVRFEDDSHGLALPMAWYYYYEFDKPTASYWPLPQGTAVGAYWTAGYDPTVNDGVGVIFQCDVADGTPADGGQVTMSYSTGPDWSRNLRTIRCMR